MFPNHFIPNHFTGDILPNWWSQCQREPFVEALLIKGISICDQPTLEKLFSWQGTSKTTSYKPQQR